ncbi:MAG: lipoyl synthase [Candidatus Marinimicrobia bacterium]|nr:lipoyl synthase [Candidatus Neomarinimicrobiota bacterium]
MMSELAQQPLKKPSWIKIRLRTGEDYKHVRNVLKARSLNTVCEEARCPNIYECWNRGTATIMILGDICTRSCGFCAIKTGQPVTCDTGEPERTAEAVKSMGLKHVVITSVDRDDLKGDFGATVWADTIKAIHNRAPGCSVEVLTPDFQDYRPALEKVFAAGPEIFSHNVECVERISRQVRAQANWQRSMSVLRQSIEYGLLTKTGLMVGLGESKAEVLETMEQIAGLGVHIFTIGQYLQPSKNYLPVKRYVELEEFEEFKRSGLNMGFRFVESGPLVRSSYHADEQARTVIKKSENE